MSRSHVSSVGRVTVIENLESRVLMAGDMGLLAGPRLFVRGGGGWDTSDASLQLPATTTPPEEEATSEEPAPAPQPEPPPLAPVTSALGGNLNMQSDRVQDHPFTDLVKLTRGFYNLAGRVHSNGHPAFATTDANGWPTEDFALSLADNAEYQVSIDAGTYKMSFTGPSGVTVAARRNAPGGAATNPTSMPLPTVTKLGYDAGTGVHTYDIGVPAGVRTLALDFRSTGGAVRDLKVLQPGYSLANHPTFRNEYLDLMRNLGPNVLRLMDWTHTNDNFVSTWDQRAKPTDATQGKVPNPGDLVSSKGIAWEYGIELANALDTGVWVNVPIQATNDYVNQLATLLRTTLEPNLRIYLEYSNEVWNSQFAQNKFNLDRAKAEVANDPNSNLDYDGTTNSTKWAERLYARRLKEITDIFKANWVGAGQADPLDTRVRAVLGGQSGVVSRFDNELAYLDRFYGEPDDFLYGIGIAPYINLGSLHDDEGLTEDQVLSALETSVDNLRNGNQLADAKREADEHNLKLVAYEGGIDTFGPTSIAAKRSAMLDPRIKNIVTDYLNVWYSKGGSQFNWYTLGARSFNSPNGTWSITEDIRDLNQPKMVGYREVRDLGLGNDDEDPPPTGTTETIRPGADAYVRDGSTYASTNFGAVNQLQVKQGSVGWNRHTYLRFDLSSVASIETARLRLFGRLDNTSAASAGFTVYSATNTTWTESGITWNNKPASGTTVRGSGTVTGTTGKAYDVDLTTFLEAEKSAGRNLVTLVVKATAASPSTIVFDSDEATTAANRPALLVTQAAATQALVVSPGNVSVPEGGTAAFTVKLAANPGADVAVGIAKVSGGDGDLSANKTTLTFTTANWDVAQAVTVAAAQDDDTTNGAASFVVSSNALESKTVAATEADDDAPTAPVTLRAGADTYVRDGSTYADTNFGNATQLQAKQGSTGWNRDSYLRFDLSSVATVSSAELRLFGRLDNTSAPSAGFTVYNSANTTWSETATTWNNRPAIGTTVRGSGTVVGTTGTWYETDLTSFLQAEKAAGRNLVTLVISPSATSPSNILFDSDEATNRPELVIASDGEPPPPQELIVSTASLTVPEGGNAAFAVELAVQPESNVVVNVSKASGGDEDLSSGTSTLTFTSANWDVAQNVTVAAAEDADTTNGTASFTVSSTGLASKTVAAAEADNDASSEPVTLRAGADTYVRDGSSYSGTNFGTSAALQIKEGAAGWNRETYLRFDLSTVSTISSATLRLFGRLDNTSAPSAGFTVYNSADTAWSETGITWNSKLTAGTTVRGSGTVTGTTGQWYELDLSAFLQAEKAAGRNLVTLVLRPSATSPSNILFESDEGTNRPELVVS